MLVPENTMSEESLYLSIKKGDKSSFDKLFLKYYPILCSYAKQFVQLEDAEEIVQDVMVWLWNNRETMVVESSLKNYLFRAVKNRCLTAISHLEIRRQLISALEDQVVNMYENTDFSIVNELTEKIEEALAKIPESYRVAFEMHRFKQMTYAQIAQELGVSSKTIDYRIVQALKILRKELKDYLPLIKVLLING